MFTGDTNWLVLPRSLQSNLVSSRCSHWRSPNVPPPAALSVASAFSGEGASSPLSAAAFLMLEMEGSLKTPLLSTLFTRSPWLPWGWHAHTHLTSLPSHCPRQVNKGVNSQGTRMCHWQQWEATAKAQGTRCQYVIAVLLQEVGGKGCRELDDNTIYHRDSFPPPLAQSMIAKECTSTNSVKIDYSLHSKLAHSNDCSHHPSPLIEKVVWRRHTVSEIISWGSPFNTSVLSASFLSAITGTTIIIIITFVGQGLST